VKNACQFRSFKIACRENDAWGCAMLGQSYQYGEGVTRSASMARSAFRKSCRLAPDFEACSFARDGIRELAAVRQHPR
jgi:TPR repeat protein